ncbi:MAG: hypothetical protein AAFX85_10965 [Pseudomonadota bacterium]
MSLKDQVDKAMPGWERWYPSLFDAAVDLGILRARPAPPSSLLLTNRHAHIREEAEAMHRDRWGGDFSNVDAIPSLESKRVVRKKKPKKKVSRKARTRVTVTPRTPGGR